MQRSIFAITYLESKSTSRRRDDSCRVPDLRRYLQVSIYPAISIAKTWKKQAATGNGWGEWGGGDGRRREPQEAATRLAIYTLHAKMSDAISEIPPCRFPVPLECHCTRSLPPAPFNSFERPFFRFVLFEACLSCLTEVHREQTSTVWRDMELTRCFENFTSRYQISQLWQKPSNTDGFQFRLGLSLSNRAFVCKFTNTHNYETE